MVLGTAYFVSRLAAVRYYVSQFGTIGAYAAVDAKLAEGDWFVGKPTLAEGETLVLLDGGTRYGVKDNT